MAPFWIPLGGPCDTKRSFGMRRVCAGVCAGMRQSTLPLGGGGGAMATTVVTMPAAASCCCSSQARVSYVLCHMGSPISRKKDVWSVRQTSWIPLNMKIMSQKKIFAKYTNVHLFFLLFWYAPQRRRIPIEKNASFHLLAQFE